VQRSLLRTSRSLLFARRSSRAANFLSRGCCLWLHALTHSFRIAQANKRGAHSAARIISVNAFGLSALKRAFRKSCVNVRCIRTGTEGVEALTSRIADLTPAGNHPRC
jgi:hypothetical protein